MGRAYGLCQITLENSLFFLDSYIARSLDRDERMSASDFQVMLRLLSSVGVGIVLKFILHLTSQMVGMVALLLSSKMFSTGPALKVVSTQPRSENDATPWAPLL